MSNSLSWWKNHKYKSENLDTSTINKILPYGRHYIDDDDIAEVVNVLKSDWLTTGSKTSEFEAAFAKKINSKHAVSCSNGTAALHLSLLALGIQPKDKVIVPSITFLSTANVVKLIGAEVIYADVDPETGILSKRTLLEAINRGNNEIDAILPVHLNGSCLNMEMIRDIASLHNMKIVEDACHALGGSYFKNDIEEAKVGSNLYSEMTAFSLHPVKAIAMGEGGVITTNNDELYQRLLRLRNHGIVRTPSEFTNNKYAFDDREQANPWYYEMHELGLNYRASELNCALGLSQLRKLDAFINKRKKLVNYYQKNLGALAPTVFPVKNEFPISAPHLFPVLIDFNTTEINRAELMVRLLEEGVGTQVHYIPLFLQPYYSDNYNSQDYPGAMKYYEQCLSLPLFYEMNEKDVERVVSTLKKLLTL